MKAEIKDLYKKGFKLTEIRHKLNISISRVNHYVYSAGEKPQDREVKSNLTEYQKSRIKQLLMFKDYTFAEIAEDLEIKAKDVIDFVRNN